MERLLRRDVHLVFRCQLTRQVSLVVQARRCVQRYKPRATVPGCRSRMRIARSPDYLACPQFEQNNASYDNWLPQPWHVLSSVNADPHEVQKRPASVVAPQVRHLTWASVAASYAAVQSCCAAAAWNWALRALACARAMS
jgi:hypothetical protein